MSTSKNSHCKTHVCLWFPALCMDPYGPVAAAAAAAVAAQSVPVWTGKPNEFDFLRPIFRASINIRCRTWRVFVESHCLRRMFNI